MKNEDKQAARPESTGLTGLRVAITGGTSGLGRALVAELGRRGARLAFVARRRELVEKTARELGAAGIVGDISKKEDIYPIALQITGALGGLDVLVNNASDLGPSPLALLADTECEDFERALATNLLGPFRLTKALLGSLAAAAREGRAAAVVNISSDAAVNAYPSWGAYGASKAALLHMNRTWEQELAEINGLRDKIDGLRDTATCGLRDTAIHMLSFDPGDMDTPMHEAALPGADKSRLKSPAQAARELADILEALFRKKAAREAAE